MKYAVMFSPFEFDGYEYVREGDTWTNATKVHTYDTKEEAEEASKKWNTGIVVEYVHGDIHDN